MSTAAAHRWLRLRRRHDSELPGPARGLRWVLGGWLIIQVAVAWMPFRLDPPRRVDNGAEVLPDGGMAFTGPRNVAIAAPPRWLYASPARPPITVDVEVRSDAVRQSGPARIFGISADYQHANLLVAQQDEDLVVRLRRPASGPQGIPPLVVRDVFADPGWHTVAVRLDDVAVAIDVDGRRASSEPLPSGWRRSWDPGYGITLGDEHVGGRPWIGRIRHAQLRVGDRTQDYLAASAVDVPSRAWLVPSRLNEVWNEGWWDRSQKGWLRSWLHLLAFLPVGWLLWRGARRPSLVRVAALSAAVAVILQVGKIVVDSRHPSLVTAAIQALGALTGAVLASRMHAAHTAR